MSDYPRWYAVHTLARSEFKAALNLKRGGFWTFAPFTREKKRVRVGHRKHLREYEAPLLSRYIFAALRDESQVVDMVNDTDGVARVVCRPFSRKALEVPHSVIQSIMDMADEEGFIASPKPPHWFKAKVGDKVILDKDDPNSVLSGLIAEIASVADLDKKDSVRVWLEMLDARREIPLRVERLTVAA